MKRRNIVIIVGIVLVAVVLIWLYKKPISTKNYTSAVIVDSLSGINEKISDEDVETLKAIFNGKRTYSDNPACGFSDKEAIIFNGKYTFQLAFDGDSIIKYKNNGKYLSISQKEREVLEEVLGKYGYHFREL